MLAFGLNEFSDFPPSPSLLNQMFNFQSPWGVICWVLCCRNVSPLWDVWGFSNSWYSVVKTFILQKSPFQCTFLFSNKQVVCHVYMGCLERQLHFVMAILELHWTFYYFNEFLFLYWHLLFVIRKFLTEIMIVLTQQIFQFVNTNSINSTNLRFLQSLLMCPIHRQPKETPFSFRTYSDALSFSIVGSAPMCVHVYNTNRKQCLRL